MIRQFVDTDGAPAGVAIGGSGVDFDSIIGTQHVEVTPVATVREVHAPSARQAPAARRRVGRGTALVAVSALAVSGIAIAGGLVLAADLVAHHALASTDATLASEKSTVEKVVTTPSTAFGSVTALGEGLVVSVSDPIAYSPSAKATGADGGVDVVSTVTVTNTGSGPADPRLALEATGTTATRIFDRTGGIRTIPTSSLGVGQSVTYRIAYAVGDPADFSLRVTDASGDTVTYGS